MYHLLFCWGLGVYILRAVWGLVPAGNRAPGEDPAAAPVPPDPARLQTYACVTNSDLTVDLSPHEETNRHRHEHKQHRHHLKVSNSTPCMSWRAHNLSHAVRLSRTICCSSTTLASSQM